MTRLSKRGGLFLVENECKVTFKEYNMNHQCLAMSLEDLIPEDHVVRSNKELGCSVASYKSYYSGLPNASRSSTFFAGPLLWTGMNSFVKHFFSSILGDRLCRIN